MRLSVLEGEHFSCHSCTHCCRTWQVELMPGEAEKIEKLPWKGDDPLRGVPAIRRDAARAFLARRADGACLFLNDATGLCRIHETFGADAKPLACRIFPFQIAPTFPGEISVAGRYDCPTVRKNEGELYADQAPALRRYAQDLSLPLAGFDDLTRCMLDREQIEAVSDFLVALTSGFAGDAERALFIRFVCEWLAQTQVDELDRSALAKAFPELKRHVEMAMKIPVKRPGWFGRASFRTLLGLYMRRDEDVVNARAGRFSRLVSLLAVILGFGSFRRLGLSHRPGKLRSARLFKRPMPVDSGAFGLHWRMIRNKLQSFQFMGNGRNGRDFLGGLRLLSLLYPLVLAVAKSSAAGRGSEKIEQQDVDYAVESIEHSHGRLAILNKPSMRSVEKLLLDPTMFLRIVRTL